MVTEHAQHNINSLDTGDFNDYKNEYRIIKHGYTNITNSAVLRLRSPLLTIFKTMSRWNEVVYSFNLAHIRCLLDKVDKVTASGWLRGDPIHVKNMMHSAETADNKYMGDKAHIYSLKRVLRIHPNEVFDVTNDPVNGIYWF